MTMMPNKDKFFTKRGEPTAYAFACGHVQIAYTKNKTFRVKLLRDEHGTCYHIYVYCDHAPGHFTWLTYHNLNDARRKFKMLLRICQNLEEEMQ